MAITFTGSFSLTNLTIQTAYVGVITSYVNFGGGGSAFGGATTVSFNGVNLTGGGGNPGSQILNGSVAGGTGGNGSYTLDSGIVLLNPAGVQTSTGGQGGSSNGTAVGGGGGGGANGATGTSGAGGGAPGVPSDWNGIAAAMAAAGVTWASPYGNGAFGQSRLSTPGISATYGGGGGGLSAVGGTGGSGGAGFVLIQYVASGTTTTTLLNNPGITTNTTIPAQCTSVKIWAMGGGGGGGTTATSSYCSSGGGAGGIVFYEWPAL
jgi:hypothetical protein